MRITCPKCQCKGLIDTAPLLSKARVTCVRCGTAFDALMADGVVETALVTETPSASVLGLEAPSESYTPVEPDEVLSLPQMACEHAHQSSETTILDFAGSPQAEVEPQPGCTAAPIHNGSLQANGLDAEHNDPLADSGEFVMPEEYVPQLSREALEHHGESDKYGMGVRQNDSRWRNAINQALMEIWDTGRYHEIHFKWFGQKPEFEIPWYPK